MKRTLPYIVLCCLAVMWVCSALAMLDRGDDRDDRDDDTPPPAPPELEPEVRDILNRQVGHA